MEEALYFIIRYIPFWAIPSIFIATPSAYIYWLKDVKKVSVGFALVSFISFLSTFFWVWAGGPDRSVQEFQLFIKVLTQ